MTRTSGIIGNLEKKIILRVGKLIKTKVNHLTKHIQVNNCNLILLKSKISMIMIIVMMKMQIQNHTFVGGHINPNVYR